MSTFRILEFRTLFLGNQYYLRSTDTPFDVVAEVQITILILHERQKFFSAFDKFWSNLAPSSFGLATIPNFGIFFIRRHCWSSNKGKLFIFVQAAEFFHSTRRKMLATLEDAIVVAG